MDEIRRMIQETEPPKPSTRLQRQGDRAEEVAKLRRTEPAVLWRSVRGDLDWIVMKALEKDRQRRYATANDLAEDIQRHLAHEPVLAGPPSARLSGAKVRAAASGGGGRGDWPPRWRWWQDFRWPWWDCSGRFGPRLMPAASGIEPCRRKRICGECWRCLTTNWGRKKIRWPCSTRLRVWRANAWS